MNIIISPDSFKGTLSAKEAGMAIREGIQSVRPDINCTVVPIADGGEGTLEALVDATAGRLIDVSVLDPLSREIVAHYGILGDGVTAVIEMAEASGITHITPTDRNPLRASTFGTGQLIRHALDEGCRKFIVAIGGSATNDGGIGALRALGIRFYDTSGMELRTHLPDYLQLGEIDLSDFDSRIASCDFSIACDVDNPLLGERGATAVFGPQKGVTPELASILENVLQRYADVVYKLTGQAHHLRAGAGAAGGLGMALLAFFPAHLERGIDSVLDAIEYDQYLREADLVITGEGKSDVQTLSGKAPLGVAERARRVGVKVALLSGMIPSQEKSLLVPHFSYVEAIVSRECTVEQALSKPYEALAQAAARLGRKL
ncbi:glycerate kinase [Chryseomicrobium aureum]|uniref:glycerate kinase n=1 Tax=Chryseomicrobium aureum TaxID=1441723 RepID=UPI00195B18DE|nr:glycerate kinase [Chryseomicrobium aureum]MBM7705851.1 glycerate kinase [Chryseomicrobium aureum]